VTPQFTTLAIYHSRLIGSINNIDVLYSLVMYIWFWMAVLHFNIHHHKVKLTLLERKLVTADECWHLINQFLVMGYLLCCQSFGHFVAYAEGVANLKL
jgi:hypothetical protein